MKVTTRDMAILLDPSCALGPVPHQPLPHPFEYLALQGANRRIITAAAGTTLIAVSHYHQDHYKPPFTNWTYNGSSPAIFAKIFQERIVFAKDPAVAIGYNQEKRAKIFQHQLKNVHATFVPSDAKFFEYDGTSIEFSPPLPHGVTGSPQGVVIATCISDGDSCFVSLPDVQGPTETEIVKWTVDRSPDEMVLGGPPFFLPELKFPQALRQAFFKNILVLGDSCHRITMDHHIFRDLPGIRVYLDLQQTLAEGGCILSNFSSHSGKQENFLEARRGTLFNEHPPMKEFLDWAKVPTKYRQNPPPPIPPAMPNSMTGEILKNSPVE